MNRVFNITLVIFLIFLSFFIGTLVPKLKNINLDKNITTSNNSPSKLIPLAFNRDGIAYTTLVYSIGGIINTVDLNTDKVTIKTPNNTIIGPYDLSEQVLVLRDGQKNTRGKPNLLKTNQKVEVSLQVEYKKDQILKTYISSIRIK